MIQLYVSALVTLFVVIDPPGCAPIFAGLTRGCSAAYRRTMAVRSVLVATAVLLLFAVAGEAFLRAMGISLDAFRAAGGVMLFLIAIEMVFEKRTERREDRAEEIKRRAETEHRPVEQEDISVFPMAIPMIAGPGSIATVMLLMSRHHGVGPSLTVVAALLSILAVMLLALLAAGPIMRVAGEKLEAMLTRILGVILAALAAQYVIDGLKGAFA